MSNNFRRMAVLKKNMNLGKVHLIWQGGGEGGGMKILKLEA